jgi:hypothetical protein
MENNMKREEEHRLLRIIKDHGGEVCHNGNDTLQVIINYDDMVDLITSVEFNARQEERGLNAMRD